MVQINELYKKLFGRRGPADGSVIDMAEHGRAGGASTHQGFKFTWETALASRVDDDGSTIYTGDAAPGTATSAASWRIKRATTSGNVTIIEWADGDDNWDNVWDDRASLSYS